MAPSKYSCLQVLAITSRLLICLRPDRSTVDHRYHHTATGQCSALGDSFKLGSFTHEIASHTQYDTAASSVTMS
ncbi:hypothetical protein BD769DRAFT_495297 [Suillus cothurnatus]|nr:hypothetical protein BD769DRAFT_495297 [Suillus cothurnatus]